MKKQTKQIQPSKSYINLFHANKTNRFKNDFYKTVKIYYQNIFIQNINIYADEKFNSIMEKIKNTIIFISYCVQESFYIELHLLMI